MTGGSGLLQLLVEVLLRALRSGASRLDLLGPQLAGAGLALAGIYCVATAREHRRLGPPVPTG